MKILAVKDLVEIYDDVQLAAMEESIMKGLEPDKPIPGDDEGEQLTHILAARWVMQTVQATGCDVMTAIRQYSQRVRKSLS